MKKYIQSIAAASLLWGALIAVPGAHAAAAATTDVFIDGNRQVDVLHFQGRMLVQLTAFHDPAWVSYSYEAKTKTVTITNKTKKVGIRLSGGMMEAEVNGTEVKLDAPVTFKNGRTYVPLRFLSETLGGSVMYDGPGKKVVVRTPAGQERYKALMSGDLTEARLIAIRLPIMRGEDALQARGEGFTINYIFPKGEALRYYKEYKDLVEYIEINAQGIAEVKWQSDEFGPAAEHREKGAKPAARGEAVFFTDLIMADLTIYGTKDSDGKSTELGRLDRSEEPNSGKFVVPIEGETRTDAT
ncbi:copper amine oxidase N-terminal domain-containing protein [Paenibacillus mendelii]|uniref:Copper amine oxidase N-terminal domain-containing protein n=1 Tax=Paenibacillus mendelii TaxID=206163 RepID=A0ABV6J6I2_9BACL|nr:copper amine oxidase N-terminal domain-containing protein [Paenibacillus mendelii]MCQ6561179.1 copper amine oxidase N-terminal domain-containing protein [Paenibacillus mendelii]